MRTLDVWHRRFAAGHGTIECPEMSLLSALDGEPPVFTGPGFIRLTSSSETDFTMFAAAAEGSEAFKRLVRSQENPHEIQDQFRLVAVDYEGTKWAGGWIMPHLKGVPSTGWLLTGSLDSLLTHASGSWVSSESGVELIFEQDLWLPMEKAMVSVTTVGDECIHERCSSGKQVVPVLDSEVHFFRRPFDESLWVVAATSKSLQHPYLENWLSEPLRILLGQPLYPRLVARNFGDGTAQVWLRPSPRLLTGSGMAALYKGDWAEHGADFWDLYAKTLSLIASSRDEREQPNFEMHPITRFYDEIIHATQGSRWVLCLTQASAAEGLAKMLMSPDERKSDFAEEDVESLKSTILSWPGNKKLRERLLSDLARVGSRSIGRYLWDLVERDVLEERNARAWNDVRHAVMHGNLVSPWATKESEERLLDLSDLVHIHAQELINRVVKPQNGDEHSDESANMSDLD